QPMNNRDHWSVSPPPRLPVTAPKNPRLGIHLKQSVFRGGQIKPPADECRRNRHHVPVPQQPMRLKPLNLSGHELNVEQRQRSSKFHDSTDAAANLTAIPLPPRIVVSQ
ncbi:MAG: hypothetical protein WBE12_13625, partial [Candidatus Acidiferrum sp.]